MNNSPHQLENIRRRELKGLARRREILAMEAPDALDAILDAKSPAVLTQSFPDQDLYYLLHHIGPSDFLPVLAMAASDQWEYILDVDLWEDDRINTAMMTRDFGLLFRADPERFLRWIITTKPAYFEFYLSKQMALKIREHDEPPPDDRDDYITFDDKFYFCFPQKKTEGENGGPDGDPLAGLPDETGLSDEIEAPELIRDMLKKLADMDLSVYHALVLETLSVLPAETEEEEFRLKNIRLAEKGFLPPHEALGIYQPAAVERLCRRRVHKKAGTGDKEGDLPLAPQCISLGLCGQDLFVNALGLLDEDFRMSLELELAALVNKVISADRIKLKHPEILKKTLEKTTAYLSLGLETLAEEDPGPEKAAGLIETYFIEDIFRTGSRACILLKQRASAWHRDSFVAKKNLPLSFLGEHFLGVMGGLFLDRPLYYAPDTPGELYRHFRTLDDIRSTARTLEQIEALDRALDDMSPLISTFELGVLTYKSLVLTLWAKDRLGLESNLNPIDMNTFKPFFTALFHGDAPGAEKEIKGKDLTRWTAGAAGMEEEQLSRPLRDLLSDLMDEIYEEYGRVSPDHADPRFIPHFLLKRDA